MEEQMESYFQLTNSKEIIAYLAQQYPNCFTLEGEAKPLKIGIFKDILLRLENLHLLSRTKLRLALRSYTMSWRYLYCIKEGTYRVDLDGNPHEVISKEQMEHAQQTLKQSKEKAKERFKKQSTVKNKNTSKSLINTKKLQLGDFIKVKVGNKLLKAQIINIEKEHIKVKVGSGMELMVKPEYVVTK